jgi:hypothetical protein
MGRPIKEKYFGNKNRPYSNYARGGNTGVGGEGVATITVSNSGTLYSQGTTLSIGAPNVAGGIQATISSSINSAGNITVAVVNSGTGYTSAPTLTVTKATTVNTVGTATNASYTLTNLTSVDGIYVGMRADASWGMQASNYVSSVGTNSVTLTKTMSLTTASLAVAFSDQGSGFAKTVALYANTTTQDAIAITSYLTTGSSAVSGGDIIKQESSRRYLVRNSQGIGQVRIGAGTGTNHVLSPGQAHIIATDGGGATYYVTKLTAHKATLINRTSTSTALITDLVAGWTLGVATGTNQVSLAKNA